MSYTVLNAAAFRAQVAAQIERVKKQAEARMVYIMKEAQIHASRISPVYSGDFASNWNVSYNTPDPGFMSSGGDYLRINESTGKAIPLTSSLGVTQGNFNMTGYKLGQPLFLSNAAKHDEPYAMKIEEGTIEFRPVNRGKDRVARKTAAALRAKLGA